MRRTKRVPRGPIPQVDEPRRCDPFPVVFGIIGLVAVLATIIAIVLLAQQTGPTTTAAPGATLTMTPMPAQPPVSPTKTPSPLPTVAISTPPVPSRAQLAASASACAPFAHAGNKAEGVKKWGAAPSQVIDKNKNYTATIFTTYGAITADILPKLGPIAANNFVFLACHDYYNGIIFHRVVSGFMIQGGDPTGTGTGGPGYTIKDDAVPRAYEIGDLAMANTSSVNTGGSQFFIIQGPQGASLPRTYALFGHVTAGQAVVNTIAQAQVHASASGEASSPNKPVKITNVTIQVS